MSDAPDRPELDARDAPRSRRRTALGVATALGIVMALFVVVLATRKSAQDKQADSPLLGHPAPSLAGTALDGTPVRLDSYRGRWVLVNFFASWCVTCVQEHPQLLAFGQRHQAAGDAVIVGVTFDDTPGAARSYMARYGGDWPILVDPNGQVGLDYGVRAPPESFLIDPNGYVVSKIIGGVVDRGSHGLEALLLRAKGQAA